jgi:hypothetical protein
MSLFRVVLGALVGAAALTSGGVVSADEAAAAATAAAPSPDVIGCQACSAAITETIARAPILAKAGARKEDKESAVYDALSCEAFTFRPYASDPAALAKACRRVLDTHNANGELVAALVAGSDAKTACAAVCEGVEEGKRMPVFEAPPPKAPKAGAKGAGGGKTGGAGGGKSAPSAPAGRKGTVDDPQVKEALKKKAERDARRAAKSAGAGAAKAAEGEAEEL